MPDLMAHFGEYRPDPGWTFYHGTPDVRGWEHGAHYGIHVGTEEAARQALHAKIGEPAEGTWDGTREYGKTLLKGQRPGLRSGYNMEPRPDHYPRPATYHEPVRQPGGGWGHGPPVSFGDREPGKVYNHRGAVYSDESPVPMDARPSIFPVRITGPMTNHPSTPHDDWKANGYMSAALKRGHARRGYFYRNVSEDEGSISAVVPSAAHLERLDVPKTAGLLEHMAAWYHGTNREFAPGEHIEPGHEPVWEGSSPEHVYFTDDPDAADTWAETAAAMKESGHPRTYQVEPTGQHEEDPEYAADDIGLDARRSRHPLRVVRKISLLEHFGAVPLCHYCHEPLDQEDIDNESSSHEECWDMHQCPVHGEHEDDPVLAEQHRDTYTDWYHHLPFAGGIHRGLVKQLPREVHDVVHDESRPSAERAQALRGYLHREGFHGGTQEEQPYGADHEGHLGVHWTPSETMAKSWGSDDMYEGPVGTGTKPSVTHIVLHAASPDEEHIETDPDHLEARHMYGFEHDRSEHEVPLKYGAPVHLTGISWKHGGQEHWHRHDFAGPSRHMAVLAEPFANPYHGTEQFGGRPEFSHTWFHGTRGTSPEFHEQYREGNTGSEPRMSQPPDERAMHSGWPQPNKLLGVHLSPLHRVAHRFAKGIYPTRPDPERGREGRPGTPSALVHARLHFDSPAHYPTEKHLNLAVARYANDHYPGWHDDKLNASQQWSYSDTEGTHRDWHAEPHYDPKGTYEGNQDFHRLAGKAQSILQWHPHLPEIIEGFKQHLEGQGHHGITYGNEVEGPGQGGHDGEWDKEFADHTYQDVRHISAIATRPSQIETARVEHIAPPETEPQAHEVEHHPPDSRYRDPDQGWESGRNGYASDSSEDKAMFDRVGAFHAEHGGAYPGHRRQAVLPGGDLSEMSGRQEGAKVEWVRTDALLKHREWHHEPGISRSPQGQQMAPKHTLDEWAANAQSVRDEGIRQPVHVHWDHKTNRAYIGEGNSRLSWAHEAGHEAVPVIGHRASGTPDGDQYQLPGPSRAAEVKERHGSHIPADISPSEFLPEHYLWHPGKTAAGSALYHSGGKDFPGEEEWVHLGTREAALNRAKDWHEERARRGAPPAQAYLHTVHLAGSHYPSERSDNEANDPVWRDITARSGHTVLPYLNEYEDPGTVSYLAHRSAVSLLRTEPLPHGKQAKIIDMASSSGDRHVTCDKGHLHWGAYGAAGLLIRHRGEDGQHRYLLQKRSPYVNEPNTWSVPGGAIGRHESPEDGAWREAREEMGSIPRHVTTHHTVTSTDCGDWKYHTVVADAGEHFMPGGRGETQHETAGVGWHTAGEIDELRDSGDLHPGFAKSWETVRRSRGPKTAAQGMQFFRGETHPRRLVPTQKRRTDPDQVAEMAGAMQARGYDGDPIDVVHSGGKLHVMDGHTRRQSAIRAGLDSVPVIGVGDAVPEGMHPVSRAEYDEVANRFPPGLREQDEWDHPKMAVITPGSLPPAQQSAFDVEDHRQHRRQMTEVGKHPEPGTRVWRGEMRDETEHPRNAPSAGMHWTANPDAVIANHSGEPGKRRVVWQGVVENHEEQAFPRSHPMWSGKHMSFDWEAEVRFRPGTHVKLEGAYVDHSGSPGYLVPQKPERTSPSWEWHPLDHHIEIKHSGHGASDYSELGIPREAAARELPVTEIGPLYHGTTAERAERILEHGFEGGTVHLTPHAGLAGSYAGGRVIKDKGGTPAVLKIERVRGVSASETGYMDPEKSRASGADYQDKGPEVVVLNPAAIHGITRHAVSDPAMVP